MGWPNPASLKGVNNWTYQVPIGGSYITDGSDPTTKVLESAPVLHPGAIVLTYKSPELNSMLVVDANAGFEKAMGRMYGWIRELKDMGQEPTPERVNVFAKARVGNSTLPRELSEILGSEEHRGLNALLTSACAIPGTIVAFDVKNGQHTFY